MNTLSKDVAAKLVREKICLLKSAYRKNRRFFCVHVSIHERSHLNVSAEQVRRVLLFRAVPICSDVAPKVFESFNAELEENGIAPIDYLTIGHHFKR